MSRTRPVRFLLRSLAAAAVSIALVGATPHQAQAADWQSMETTAARVDNPLKGFMPFSGDVDHASVSFPYTMEWLYLPLDAVVTGERQYDWSRLEQQLEAAAGRGHQLALRFYLDYPDRQTGVPAYLLGPGGIDQSRRYDFQKRDFSGAQGAGFSPDYEDPRVRALITDFVAAFGARYDGDPRIGFITTGLVGFWGEQHTWPMNGVRDPGQGNPEGLDWMPSRQTQLDFFRAWDAAFDTTRLLNRYPSADLKDVDAGFHDDSFAASTLPGDSSHFLSLMDRAGLSEQWRSQSIGGELRPELQECIFARPVNCTKPPAEDFDRAVRESHASWLVNQHAFTNGGYSGADRERALAAHASLGYDFAAVESRIRAAGSGTEASVRITNRGVAPFPYDWPAEFLLLDEAGRVLATQRVDTALSGLQPGETLELSATLPAGPGTVVLRVPNPMAGGAPVRFANTAQSDGPEGYLHLGPAR